MVRNAQRLLRAFAGIDGFKEYFAVKALPNPFILKILNREGLGADCSSSIELLLSKKCGLLGEDIMFTSNDTPTYEYADALELGAIINLDDISHISVFGNELPVPGIMSCRYNPGPLRAGNVIIGHPEEAKYGFTRDQLFEGYRMLRDLGVSRFGLHTMVASNELNPSYFVETVQMLLDLVIELHRELGIRFEFVNMGGGIGIPYRPGQQAVDLEFVGKSINALYNRMVRGTEIEPIKLFMECGRMITGPYGCLVSKVVRTKQIYKNYIGLDSSMANLMRPGMYGAYHHISVLGKEGRPSDRVYDVTGSLCENNDKFAVDRQLPEVAIGDLLVIQDTGAHGHSMGFNYNGKLRSAEILLRRDNSLLEIRRAETAEDHFATLDFSGLGSI